MVNRVCRISMELSPWQR